MNPHNIDFSLSSVRNCYPYPSLTECKLSNALYCEFIVGFLLCLPIFFLLAKLVRNFISSRQNIGNGLIQFLSVSTLSYVNLVLNVLFPIDCAKTGFYYQFFPMMMNTISYIILAEEAAITLKLVNSKYSSFLKYALSTIKYICIAFATFIAFFSAFFKKSGKNKQLFIQYVPSIYLYTNLLIQLLVIGVLIVAYIYTPAIKGMLGKKTTITVYVLMFAIAFFIFIFFICKCEEVSMIIRLVAISKGINFALYTQVVIDFITDYLPRIIQAIAMWVLFYGNLDNNEDTIRIDDIISGSLVK